MGHNADIASAGTGVASGAAAQSRILAKVPTVVHAITAQSVTAQYILLFDAIVVPSNADTTAVEVIRVPATGTVHLQYPKGKAFANGVVWVTSSTAPALTAGASDAWVGITADQ